MGADHAHRHVRPCETRRLSFRLFAQVFVTILVILDPAGNVPVFLSLTRDRPGDRPRAAVQATLVAAGVILAFALFGQGILDLLGISVEALQVSGGLVLALVALELLQRSSDRPAGWYSGNVALVPVGTPLLAGPGAIAATMVYIQSADDTGETATVIAALLLALAVVYLGLRYAVALAGLLKENGIELLSRVVGLLLAAIAVQLVAEGIDRWVREGVR